jgi:hypothetical protein
MKKQSIIQAILDAIDDTDDSMNKHMNQLIKWSKYCEKAIGSLNGYPMKSSLITVTGSSIIVPDDCYRVYRIFLGDFTDELNLRYQELGSIKIHVENVSDDLELEYVWQDLSYSVINKLLWEEIGDKVSLIDEYDEQDVTILYQYIETDQKGYWLVNDSHIEAIKRYLIYMIAKKYMFKNFKSSKLTRNSDIMMLNEYKRDYNVGIRNARAQDQKESTIDTRG